MGNETRGLHLSRWRRSITAYLGTWWWYRSSRSVHYGVYQVAGFNDRRGSDEGTAQPKIPLDMKLRSQHKGGSGVGFLRFGGCSHIPDWSEFRLVHPMSSQRPWVVGAEACQIQFRDGIADHYFVLSLFLMWQLGTIYFLGNKLNLFSPSLAYQIAEIDLRNRHFPTAFWSPTCIRLFSFSLLHSFPIFLRASLSRVSPALSKTGRSGLDDISDRPPSVRPSQGWGDYNSAIQRRKFCTAPIRDNCLGVDHAVEYAGKATWSGVVVWVRCWSLLGRHWCGFWK